MTSNSLPPQCKDLQAQVDILLGLMRQEPDLRTYDTTAIQASLRKAIAPQFEIVFAGAFSAGKSMLINALLGRELLYSAEGHATGTECQIAYAESPSQERVVLTFMSEAEIRELVNTLCTSLNVSAGGNINQPNTIDSLKQQCQSLIAQEGGENRSEIAKQANALKLLLEGFTQNRDRIRTVENATYSMEQFNFSNLQEAASYARRGVNSSVLKRIEYYCCDPLLQDGNVIVDTPGIDAPVERDAQLTYAKIENPDTSAVVCVLKPASAGEMTPPETKLLEKTKLNPGIRDRVFYVFNRIDETWYNAQLRQRLDRLINTDFRDSKRIYPTSGLLGFYGSQLKQTNLSDRFGLDSIFQESVKGLDGREETPQFVYAFNSYCGTSGKLPSDFRVEIKGYESPNENYVRILRDWGIPLIEQLINDSGIQAFREGITRYLTEEKRPLLFSNFADDLQPLCIIVRKHYLEAYRHLDSQPREIDVMKAQELAKLSQELKEIGDQVYDHICLELNEAIASDRNTALEGDYGMLSTKMVHRLDELIATFSVGATHQRAQASHRRNSVVPVMGILIEAFYYLANELEDVLVVCSQELVSKFFQGLIGRVQQTEYYRHLYRLLGNDGSIEANLKHLQNEVTHALMNEAKTECDRYVRECPEFYAEGTVSIWQLRQTLQQACRGYDYKSMIDAEPAIRQLLKIDFEQKVRDTVKRTYRQTINQTLNDHLLQAAKLQTDMILQQYDQARIYLAKTLEKEAEEKIKANERLQEIVKQRIDAYNQVVSGINSCLEVMQLDRKKLPIVTDADLLPVAIPTSSEAFASIANSNDSFNDEMPLDVSGN